MLILVFKYTSRQLKYMIFMDGFVGGPALALDEDHLSIASKNKVSAHIF